MIVLKQFLSSAEYTDFKSSVEDKTYYVCDARKA